MRLETALEKHMREREANGQGATGADDEDGPVPVHFLIDQISQLKECRHLTSVEAIYHILGGRMIDFLHSVRTSTTSAT